jgi:hypothetical protein
MFAPIGWNAILYIDFIYDEDGNNINNKGGIKPILLNGHINST